MFDYFKDCLRALREDREMRRRMRFVFARHGNVAWQRSTRPEVLRGTQGGASRRVCDSKSGGPGDRSVLVFRILPKPGCWHRQVIVSTGFCAHSRKACRSFNEGTSVMADQKIRIRLKAFDHRLIDRSASEI